MQERERAVGPAIVTSGADVTGPTPDDKTPDIFYAASQQKHFSGTYKQLDTFCMAT